MNKKLEAIVEMFNMGVNYKDTPKVIYPHNKSRVAVVASICIQDDIPFSVTFPYEDEPEVHIYE